jgi:hypothetical protein
VLSASRELSASSLSPAENYESRTNEARHAGAALLGETNVCDAVAPAVVLAFIDVASKTLQRGKPAQAADSPITSQARGAPRSAVNS